MDLKIFTDNIEGDALNQIYTLAKHPAFADAKIRIMPDVHAGKGCVIGFTADLGDKVVPNLVGVDIGCGMLTVKLGKIGVDFEKLDKVVRQNVPSGREVQETSNKWSKLTQLRCYGELREIDRLHRSMGTLGGGNHFIEIDEDDDNNKYLIIHTGSRNLGKQVAEYYQQLAIETLQGKAELEKMQEDLIREYKANGRQREIEKGLKELKRTYTPKALGIPKDLCYLTEGYREDYLHDMILCQEFASDNRYSIAAAILQGMDWMKNCDIRDESCSFETIHNYIEPGTNIIRKGAIAAYEGQKVLIPMNMRDGCIIGTGRGNPDWNCSAPHGAGRLFSRSAAKELISLEEFRESMKGIYTTSVNNSTIDESPMAYKPMEEIIEKINDTVEIDRIIKAIYNFKASE